MLFPYRFHDTCVYILISLSITNSYGGKKHILSCKFLIVEITTAWYNQSAKQI